MTDIATNELPEPGLLAALLVPWTALLALAEPWHFPAEWVRWAWVAFDVVLADPPYAAGEREITQMLTALRAGGWLAELMSGISPSGRVSDRCRPGYFPPRWFAPPARPGRPAPRPWSAGPARSPPATRSRPATGR